MRLATADPRLAGDQHHAPASAERILQRGIELHELTTAADEELVHRALDRVAEIGGENLAIAVLRHAGHSFQSGVRSGL